MSTKPRLLDLFCGAGGAGMGYHRAGFDVVGVDIEPHPDYPFPMLVADAMEFLAIPTLLAGFDAVHASPPCQHYANVTTWRGSADDHPDLLPAVREALITWGGVYVIENVPEAPVRPDYLLCGSMFGLRVKRHRAFETNATVPHWAQHCNSHRGLMPFEHKAERAYTDAMGCEWMTVKDGRDAIPPAYTEHIGRQLIDHLGAA